MRTLFFTARRAVRRHAGVGEGSPDSPWLRYLSRKTRASQVPGPSSSCVPWSKTPPGADAPRPSPGATAVAFRQIEILDTRNDSTFRGQTPTARLATGPGGLTLGRAGFAPAGRQTKFHGGIASSLPLRPVLPGRTNFGGPVQLPQRFHTAMGQVGCLVSRLVVAEVAPLLLWGARVGPFGLDDARLRDTCFANGKRFAGALPGRSAPLDTHHLLETHLLQVLRGAP